MSGEYPNIQPLKDLDFIVAFDGNYPGVGEEEQQQVKDRFKNVLENCFLTYATALNTSSEPVKGFDLRRKIPAKDAELLIERPLEEFEGSRSHSVLFLISELGQFDDTDSLEILAEKPGNRQNVLLVINEHDNGRPAAMVSYQYDSHDGVVRRVGPTCNKDTDSDALQENLETPPLPPSAEVKEYLPTGDAQKDLERAWSNIAKNEELTREMGFDDQPISIKEMIGLEEFLQQPGFVVV